MPLEIEQIEEKYEVKRYQIQYPASAYTFPKNDRIRNVQFDKKYIHVKLVDGRILSIPLRWIPSLYNASPEEREKYEISRNRMMIIWDPNKCAINDEIRIADYLGHNNDKQ